MVLMPPKKTAAVERLSYAQFKACGSMRHASQVVGLVSATKTTLREYEAC